MLLKITLVVSLCAGLQLTQVQKRIDELKKQHPGAKVTVRVDQKCKIDLPEASHD